MSESISRRVGGRMAAVLFFISGLVGLANAALPDQGSSNRVTELAVNLLATAVGVTCWLTPWQRWPRRATLWLVPAAFLMMISSAVLGAYDGFTYGVYIMIVFVWMGISHPRWTALKFLPFGAVTYLIPSMEYGHDAMMATIPITALSGLVGEALSWVSTMLRDAELLDGRRLWEMQTLLRSGERLASESDGGRAADLAADLATQLLRANGALVFLPEDSRTLVVAGSARWSPSDSRAKAHADMTGVLFDVMRSNRTDTVDPAVLPRSIAEGHRERCLLAVPLGGASATQGVLLVDLDQKRRFDAFDEHLALSFGTQAGLMLERLHAVEALESDTLRDELTGIGNRRHANRLLTKIRPGDAVVLIDLDHFKELNDSQGHAAGDAALCGAAELLRDSMREGDHALRWGGDEFLLMLRGVGTRALEIVERMRDTWSRRLPELGFSAGVAVHEEGDIAAETLARSDQALYKAKRDGRNRTSADGAIVVPGEPTALVS